MDKDKQIQKVSKLSLEKLSEDSRLVKRGLRDLNVWPKIEELFNELKEKYQAGLPGLTPDIIDECFQLCEEVFKTDPNHFFTLCYYARCLFHKGDYEKALEYLTRCLDEESSYFFLWQFRGDCYWKLGDYKSALNDYLKSIELDSSNGAAYDNAAMCFFNTGEHDKAHEFIDKAIALDDQAEMPMIRKAQFLEYQERITETIEQYKKALNKFPNSEYAKKKIAGLSKNHPLY